LKVKLNGSGDRYIGADVKSIRKLVLISADAADVVVLRIKRFEFFDRRSHRKKVNTLHSLRNIRQAARNSVRSKQTRKERVPWAYWILRVVAIGSAVYRDKRIGTRTNESSDHNRYDLHTLSRLV
jgi:hypothetical protein